MAAYSLKCSDPDINPERFEEIFQLEEIVVSILKKYMQSFHDRKKNLWTKENLVLSKLDKSSGNFGFKEFKVTVSEKYQDIAEEIQNFKPPYEKGNKIGHVYFDRHLFQPLLLKDEGTSPIYEIIPVGLNEGEKRFIETLKKYAALKSSEFSEHRQIFVLRNLPKVGIGFFIKTINYYPDFIVWIKTDDMQRIIFADPKGLTHITNGFNDEKIKLYEYLKDMGTSLSEKLSGEKQKIKLDSYIISMTPARDLKNIFQTSQSSMFRDHHILIQEDGEKYITQLLDNAEK